MSVWGIQNLGKSDNKTNFLPRHTTLQITENSDYEHRLGVFWVGSLPLPFTGYVTLSKNYLISLHLGLLICPKISKSVYLLGSLWALKELGARPPSCQPIASPHGSTEASILHTVVPPYLRGVCSKAPSGWQQWWIVLNPIYTVFSCTCIQFNS